ncbi:serine/threonine-protein kinase VRK2 isoform X1 [Arapaima gigas]
MAAAVPSSSPQRVLKMPPRKQGLPPLLPEGWIVEDTERKSWRLGKIIGQGGFGTIYLASRHLDVAVSEDTSFVIKVEPAGNGPLFTELKFYQRAAKPDSLRKWRTSHGLNFLGIPAYGGSGLSEYKGTRFRFMVVERLGTDLQKVCQQNGGRLKAETVLKLGCRLLDVLEFIHQNEYVHADIKAANLLLGYRDPTQVYLADYGLSYRYCPRGVHKVYKPDPKRRHDGTIEYTSIDAHKGVATSRRGDLEVLGYCLLHWLSGSLPWDSVLKNPLLVQAAKTRLMENLPDSVLELSGGGGGMAAVAMFLQHVNQLDYEEKPNYQLLRDILSASLRQKDDLLDFCSPEEEHNHKVSVRKNLCFGVSAPQRAARTRPAARGASRPRVLPVDGKDMEADAEGQQPSPALQRHRRAKAVPPKSSSHTPLKELPPKEEKTKGAQTKRVFRWAEPELAAHTHHDLWAEGLEQEESHLEPRLPEPRYSLRERPAGSQDSNWALKHCSSSSIIIAVLLLIFLVLFAL